MSDTYTILVPDITAASLSANPVIASAALTFSITITEKSVVLEPEVRYSGEYYSGEV